MTTEPLHPDAQLILDDARKATLATCKNSKLRAHYLKLVMMNNIMRAFVTMYDLNTSYRYAQEALLNALCRVETRRDRAWFTSDKVALEEALFLYEELITAADEEQLREVMEYVEFNRDAGQWGVLSRKSIKQTHNRLITEVFG